MAKKPDERWQSAHDVRMELNWLEQGVAGKPEPIASKAHIPDKLGWAAALLLLVVAGLLAVIHFRGSAQPAQPVHSSLMPPRHSSFLPYNFAVSPDGTRLAFVAVGPDGKNTLWVRTLASTHSPPTTPRLSPWSPTGMDH